MTIPLQRLRSPAPPAITPGGGAAWAEAALARAARPQTADALCVVTVPAPVTTAETLLAVMPVGDAFLWDPPGGPAIAGVGVACGARAQGRERFEQIERAAAAFWPRVDRLSHPAAAAPPPRLYGGFAFAPGAATSEAWAGFGDADFALPRWSYGVGEHGAWLSLAVSDWHEPHIRRSVAAAIERTLTALASQAGRPGAVDRPIRYAVDEQSPALWRRQVDAIRRAIVRERCEKIVAARSCSLAASEPLDATEVLGRLSRSYADCYRFAFRRGDSCFVGATPERLIARSGDRVDTVALAGTAPVGDDGALLASQKDRGEQAPVVRAIREALAPLCRELVVPAEPRVRALPSVLHLETPINGELARPTHVLQLAAALHPTPAVGGFPTAAALSWIAEHEPEGRGWYAAPIGWFDASGDGELAVAIRSGLLCGRRATLYAGAGIVRDSDPDAELAETRLKLRALESALGAMG